MAKYDPTFIGLTGSIADLQAVWKNYGVAVSHEALDSSRNYEVNHSSYIYAVDGQGNWRLLYSYDTATAPVVSDILHLIKEYGG
jgi:protein SCO1/2